MECVFVIVFVISNIYTEMPPTYFQDWLNVEFDSLNVTVEDVQVGRLWLRQMGEAAARNGITVQYCMAPSRAILQALEIPVVTQVRSCIKIKYWYYGS